MDWRAIWNFLFWLAILIATQAPGTAQETKQSKEETNSAQSSDPVQDDAAKLPELASEIMRRVEADQKARFAWIDSSKQAENNAAKAAEEAKLVDEIGRIDEENRAWLKQKVVEHGWLGKSLVGAKAAQAAWLLVQHADSDPDFQKDCLARMEAAPKGEVEPINIAYLTDRVLCAEKQPQVYGTQCRQVNGEFLPSTCTEPALLNQRRQSVGLAPIEEYLLQMRAMYQSSQPLGDPQLPAMPKENPELEAISMLGAELAREPKEELPAEFLEAERNYQSDPKNADNAIWFGRRLAYLGKFRAAVEVFTKAIAEHPGDARLYRHRGHRWITLRQFRFAKRDLEIAANLIADKPDQVEPDGQPNPAGIPTSSLHTNIWYHLGLANYLLGDYLAANAAYDRCLAASQNDDMRVATLYWKYLCLRKTGQAEAASQLIANIQPDLKLLENHAYHRLLIVFQGNESADSLRTDLSESPIDRLTVAYGLAQQLTFAGQNEAGHEALEKIVGEASRPGTHWAAFALIAAEVEIAQRGGTLPK